MDANKKVIRIDDITVAIVEYGDLVRINQLEGSDEFKYKTVYLDASQIIQLAEQLKAEELKNNVK